ncbi:hypothetical protein QDG88_11610 [Pseudoalteromonas piscicida]|uniref:hypothetical protein n=1 Tax=Pseudoalteromonas piscicida TaxID=43662 RepID=UPI002739C54E|nr:hypothetical protein [Pseudoalteromonas piscicida]MDP4488569.1 hypothetical protein [Pseudoalteromonas piscicida]
MSEIKTRFLEQYHKHNLATEPYAVYGSGGGCEQILALIKQDALVAPAMLIDDKPGTDTVTGLTDLTREDIKQYKIVVSSQTFFYAIKDKLLERFAPAELEIISLLDYQTSFDNPLYRSEQAWKEHTRLARRDYEGAHTADFARDKFYIGEVNPAFADRFRQVAESLPRSGYDTTASQSDYTYYRNFASLNDDAEVQRLQLTHEARQHIDEFLAHVYDDVCTQLGYNWQVVNGRITRLAQISDSQLGSNAYHTDSLPDTVIKLLLFLTPPSKTLGTTAIKTEQGQEVFVTGPTGTWALLEVSQLLHRGISSDSAQRIVCELTITPSRRRNTEATIKGIVSHYPLMPWQRCSELKVCVYPIGALENDNWAIYGDSPSLFYNTLSPESEQPVELYHDANSVALVYLTPRTFNLEQSQLQALLAESLRVLKPDGDLLLQVNEQTQSNQAALLERTAMELGFTFISSEQALLKSIFSDVTTLNATDTHILLFKKPKGDLL